MQRLKSLLTFSAPLAIAYFIGTRGMNYLRPPAESPVPFTPGYSPVAVFVGGTAGIGGAMVNAFGRYTSGNASIVIIGRNRAAAESILSQLPRPSGSAVKHEFIQCDVTSMKNVHATTQELLSRYPKINFLVLTAGFMSMKGRVETEEGIDTKLAAHYYSRWKFIDGLLPAIRKAYIEKEDAKVISVFSAGKGSGVIDMSDLGLKRDYTIARAAAHATAYNDLMMDEFASQNPGLTFIHSFPGGVRTGLLSSSDTALLRVAGPVVNAILYPFLSSPEECATKMWRGVFTHSGGAYQLGSDGVRLQAKSEFHGTIEQRKQLWEHTMETTLRGM